MPAAATPAPGSGRATTQSLERGLALLQLLAVFDSGRDRWVVGADH